jgi:hypothetical protein
MRIVSAGAGVGLLMLLLCIGRADAQTPDPARPPKAPPTPLFPRHGRGVYVNAAGVEVIDATPQSPPLETDDPAVPAPGEYEINLSTAADFTKDSQSFDLLHVDANYGVRPVIAGYKLPTQIKFEIPVSAQREAGGLTTGFGDAVVGLKLNFHDDEHRGISVSVYPQLAFAMPGQSVEKGLASAGQTISVPVLVVREFHVMSVVFNGAIEKPVHDPDRGTTSAFSVGVGRAITRKVAAMLEVRSAESLDFKTDRLVVVNAGVIHGVRNIVVYANLGHSVFSDDGHGHTFVGTGIKVFRRAPGA